MVETNEYDPLWITAMVVVSGQCHDNKKRARVLPARRPSRPPHRLGKGGEEEEMV